MVYTYTKRCKITAKTIKLSAFFSSPPNVNFQRRLLNNVGKSYDSWDLCLLWPAVVHLKIDWSIRKCPWFQQSTFLNFAIYWHTKGLIQYKKKTFFRKKKILRYWWSAFIISVVSLEVCLFFFWQNFPGSSVRNLLKVRCKAICFFFYNGRGSAYWFWCSLMAKKSFWKIKQI